jgi:dTDP-glucose pyrophosphorylase
LVLAAGLGSRYGGVKQIDPVGMHGEALLDYSVYDAYKSGYGKVVFIIRPDIEKDFRERLFDRIARNMDAEYVFQTHESLLNAEQIKQSEGRTKPWGTIHALLCAKDVIKEPFTVINADDFYGKDAFMVMADFLKREQPAGTPHFAMVGYKLANTLSENGTVSRGVCTANERGELVKIQEMTQIGRDGDRIQNTAPDGTETLLQADTPVSMNFWGFTPLFFEKLDEQFVEFLTAQNDNPKSEFQIPTVINYFLQSGKACIEILKSDAKWFGVTYKEDRPYVVARLAELED